MRRERVLVSQAAIVEAAVEAAGGGGGSSIPSETALEGAVEGSATDVISVPELKSAATTTESATETAF
jgi:hypothetical protein